MATGDSQVSCRIEIHCVMLIVPCLSRVDQRVGAGDVKQMTTFSEQMSRLVNVNVFTI